MIAWIALVLAVIAIVGLAFHSVLPDSDGGGIAHERAGIGSWLLSSFPALRSATRSLTGPISVTALDTRVPQTAMPLP